MSRPDIDNEASGGFLAAAVLSAAAGCAALGVVTSLTESVHAVRDALAIYLSVGPLSGKVAVAVFTWATVWVVLHNRLKRREVDFDRIIKIVWTLVAVGVFLTFPPIFYLFS